MWFIKMLKSLTVGELKKALSGVDNNLPVYCSIGLRFINTSTPDTEYYVENAKVSPHSSISNEHFCIELGESFGW